MHHQKSTIVAALTVALASGACNRDAVPSRDAAKTQASRDVDRSAELQRQREEEISRLDKRVADVERKYAEKNQKAI